MTLDERVVAARAEIARRDALAEAAFDKVIRYLVHESDPAVVAHVEATGATFVRGCLAILGGLIDRHTPEVKDYGGETDGRPWCFECRQAAPCWQLERVLDLLAPTGGARA